MSAVAFSKHEHGAIWVEAPTVRGYGWTLYRQSGGYAVYFVTNDGDEDGDWRVEAEGTSFAYEPCQPEDMDKIDVMNDLQLVRAAHADIIGSIAEMEFGISNFGDITPDIRKQIITGQ